jgi:hypothetical protein
MTTSSGMMKNLKELQITSKTILSIGKKINYNKIVGRTCLKAEF